MNGRIEVMRGSLLLGALPAGDAAELLRVGFLHGDDQFRPEADADSAWRSMSELELEGNVTPSTSTSPSPPAKEPSQAEKSPAGGKVPGRRWAERARQTLTTATGVAGAVGAAGLSAVSSASTRLRSLAGQAPSTVAGATNAMLEGYLPQIRAALAQTLAAAGTANARALDAIQTGVRDDALMQKTFGAVYDCLPKPVCRFISEDRFVAFCLEHRTRLLK